MSATSPRFPTASGASGTAEAASMSTAPDNSIHPVRARTSRAVPTASSTTMVTIDGIGATDSAAV